MSYRPLVFVSGLMLGDYLLWNWSLNSDHEVIALIAGLTLPPLALATLWMLAVRVARLLARGASRPAARPAARAGSRGRTGPPAGDPVSVEERAPEGSGAPPASRRIAA